MTANEAKRRGAKRYVFGNNPENVPLSGQTWWNDGLIWLAGFDPDDEEITGCELAADWNGHAKGALVVTGLISQGHPFAVVDL